MPAKKQRIDSLLVSRGFFETSALAERAVMAGKVRVGDRLVDKPGTLVPEEAALAVDVPAKFASRGGLKLEAALDRFDVSPEGKVCLDIGASTGGFTDCLLQRGASFVHAVDVGKGLLDWRLRNDARVRSHEGLNARFLGSSVFDPPPRMAVGDVSFISLTQILPPVFEILPAGADLVFLIKPQFEAPKDADIPGGVVRDPELRKFCIQKIRTCVESLGHRWIDEMESPVPGRDGNIEHLAHLRSQG